MPPVVRAERQPQPVEERIDEQQQHEQRSRRRPASGVRSRAAHDPARSRRAASPDTSGSRARPARSHAPVRRRAPAASVRTCRRTPPAVTTSTSESRPPYSTLSTVPSISVGRARRLVNQPMSSGRIAARTRVPARAASWRVPVNAMPRSRRDRAVGAGALDRQLELVAIAHEARDVQVRRLRVDLGRRARSAAPCRPSSRRCGRRATAPRPGRA